MTTPERAVIAIVAAGLIALSFAVRAFAAGNGQRGLRMLHATIVWLALALIVVAVWVTP